MKAVACKNKFAQLRGDTKRCVTQKEALVI